MITLVFSPLPISSKGLVDNYAEISVIANKFSEEIVSNFVNVEGYMQLNLCVPHRICTN